MLPHQTFYLVPILVLCIVFSSFYVNIRRAEKQVREWKRGTAYWFVRSSGLGGVKTRAELIWKKRLGYNDVEARTLAQHQSQAAFFAFFGGGFLMAIAANCIER